MLICRESIFGKIVFHLRRIGISPSFKRIEFTVIDLLSLVIMSCQRNISFGIVGIESGYISAVQCLQGSQIRLVIPDLIEQMDEYRIRLPVYVSQFDTLVRDHLQSFTAKEERRRINILQHPPFLFFHDRCQLLQIADHQQLHPAERFVPVSVTAEHIAHSIQQIRPDHTDLVDNE